MDHEPPSPPDPSPPEPPPPPPPPPGGRRTARTVAIGVGAVALLAIVGGVAAFLLVRGSGERLLDKIPEGTDVVATIYLDPSAGQKVNLLRIVDDLPALGSRDELTDRVDDALNQVLSSTGLDANDLGWVGAQVAVAVEVPGGGSDPAFTVLIDADDEGAAGATLAQLRARSSGRWTSSERHGVEVWSGAGGEGSDQAYAIASGTVYVSSSADAIDTVLATAGGEGPSIQDSAEFRASMAGLPEDRLGMLFVNASDLVQDLRAFPGVDAAAAGSGLGDLEVYRALGMSVSAEPNGLAVDVEITYDPAKMSDAMRESLQDQGSERALLAEVPGDALVVIHQGNATAGLEDAVDGLRSSSPDIARQLDRLGVTWSGGLVDSLTGEVALEGGASDEVGASGALLLGTNDEDAMERALGALSGGLAKLATGSFTLGEDGASDARARPPARWVAGNYRGISVRTLEGPSSLTPFRPSYAVIDGAGVIGLTPEAVRAVIDTQQDGSSIEDSSAYTDALAEVPHGTGSIYADIDGIGAAVRSTLPPDALGEYDRQVGPTVDHLDALVAGTEATVEHQHLRVFLRVTS
jgi:hypothetical protein